MENYSQAQPSLVAKLTQNLKRGLLKAPANLLKQISHLPHQLQQNSINLILNHVLKTALADEELDFLCEKWLMINITDVPYDFYISVNQAQQLEITMSQRSTTNFPHIHSPITLTVTSSLARFPMTDNDTRRTSSSSQWHRIPSMIASVAPTRQKKKS